MADRAFIPVNIAVLTVSDTRTTETDTSGRYIADTLAAAGHLIAARAIVTDTEIGIRAQLAQWIADPFIDVVIATGGTGVTPRDVTPEAMAPLITKHIPGFGELFRQMSFADPEPRRCRAVWRHLRVPAARQQQRREARRRQDPDPAARSPHQAVQLRDAAAADPVRASNVGSGEAAETCHRSVDQCPPDDGAARSGNADLAQFVPSTSRASVSMCARAVGRSSMRTSLASSIST
jgi:molybdenum cofactor synthesis domain-containing protein